MEIKATYSIGDKLWTIRDCRAKQFTVGAIIYNGEVYYGETRFDAIPESMCFPSKEALIDYISRDNGDQDV